MKKSSIIKSIIAICMVFQLYVGTPLVYANNYAPELISKNEAYLDSNIELFIYINSSESEDESMVAGIQGEITWDEDIIELINYESISLNTDYNDNRIIGLSLNESEYINDSKNIIKLIFKAKSIGSTTISFKCDLANQFNNKIFSDTISKVINVKEKKILEINKYDLPIIKSTFPSITQNKVVMKSANADLKELSVDNYELNPIFNINRKTYLLTIPKSENNITINAVAYDNKSKIDGVGNILLKDDVTIHNIIVTAENGNKKTYTILIKKKDNEEIKKSNIEVLNFKKYMMKNIFKQDITSQIINMFDNKSENNIENTDDSNVVISENSNWKKKKKEITFKIDNEESTDVYIIDIDLFDAIKYFSYYLSK